MAREATEAIVTDAAEANEANKAEADEADKADVPDQPTKADKAKADKANEAANEADAKADEADKAIATRKSTRPLSHCFDKANKLMRPMMQQPTTPMRPLGPVCPSRLLILTGKEDGVLDNQLAELEKLDTANKAIVSNKAGELSDLAVTNDNELMVARSGELDEFIEVDEAVQLNELVVTNKAVDELNELVVAKGLFANNIEKISEITVHLCYCWRPLSFTKYCAIFSKDKGYFCPIANNNQLGGGAIEFNG